LVEPFGAGAFSVATQYWTASQRNTQMPPLVGDLLVNKAIWTGFAVAMLGLAYGLFSFQAAERSGRSRKGRELAAAVATEPEAAPIRFATELARPSFGPATAWGQLWARTKLDAAQVFLGPAYFVLLGLAAVVCGGNAWFSTRDTGYGG